MRSSASQNPSLPSLSVFTSYNLIVSLLLFLFLYPLYVSFHESLVHRALISSFLSSKFHSKTPKKCLPSLNFFSTYCQYHSFVQWEDWKKKKIMTISYFPISIIGALRTKTTLVSPQCLNHINIYGCVHLRKVSQII